MTIRIGNSILSTSAPIFSDISNRDLSNLTEVGEKHFLNKSQITNCLLEVPKRIKLELNNGVLTLKAGSVVIVPNGFKEDGTTPKFDYVTITSDVTANYGTGRTNCMVILANNAFEWAPPDHFVSGSTNTNTEWAWWVWYDTSTNRIKFYNGTTTIEGIGFPICLISENEGSGVGYGVKSIDQIFNGMGYIGSTIWVDKGVKYLVANGRNTDGTLKNYEITLSEIKFRTFTHSLYRFAGLNYGGVVVGIYDFITKNTQPTSVGATTDWYNPETNIVSSVRTNGTVVTPFPEMPCGLLEYSDTVGTIKSFQPFQSLKILGYNDSHTIAGWSMPSDKYIDLTLGASGATYIAPANGWVFFQDTGNQPYSALVLRTMLLRVSLTPGASGNPIMSAIMPVKKGVVFFAEYAEVTGENRLFRFIYAEGEA